MDIKIDPVFLSRLIEVTSSGIGAFARPWMIRRVARAEADAYLIKARAELQVRRLADMEYSSSEADWVAIQRDAPTGGQGPLLPELWQRARQRAEEQDLKRQLNVESVVLRAGQEEGPTPPADSPDPDWIARFFGAVQDVSTEEMQSIWAKILAGEIREPGRFSLRTLDVLRSMTQSEARLLASIAGCFEQRKSVVLFGSSAARVLTNLMPLVEAGLLHPHSFWRLSDPGTLYTLKFPGYELDITAENVSRFTGLMDRHDVTAAGKQLLTLITATPHREYVDQLIVDLRDATYRVELREA